MTIQKTLSSYKKRRNVYGLQVSLSRKFEKGTRSVRFIGGVDTVCSGFSELLNGNFLNFITIAEYTEAGGYKFGIHVSISEAGKTNSTIAKWWNGMIQSPTLIVGGLGKFGLWGNEGNEKFPQDYSFGVTEKQLEDHIIRSWSEWVAFMNQVRNQIDI